MKAIYIKWLPATNTKGTRVKADTKDGNSITLPRNYHLDFKEQGEKAAYALCDKMGWNGDLIGNGDVFVFAKEGGSKRQAVTA